MTNQTQNQHIPFRNRFAANNPKKNLSPEQLQYLEKIESARHASRQSTGPTSPEGKRIAAQNARKHGYAGATMAISDEDRPAYRAHVESYIQAFNPQNQPQADAVRLAANALWRTDRLTTIEASLLELEIEWNAPFTDIHVTGLEPRHHLAIAFVQNLTEGSNALDLCRRYLSSAQRDFHRAIATFEKLKDLTSAVPIPEPQAEAIPEPAKPAHTAATKPVLMQSDPNELAKSNPSAFQIARSGTPSTTVLADPVSPSPQKAA